MLKGSLEENVLALLCHSTEHSSRVAMEVKVELYSTASFRIIAKAAIAYLDEYNRPPGTHLVDILENEIARGAEGQLILSVVNTMAELFPTMNEEFIVAKLAYFTRKAAMSKAGVQYVELVQRDKLDEAEAVMHGIEEVAPLSRGIWAHEPTEMLSFLDIDEEDQFSSGITALDERGCCPARKTMMIMIAPPKKGKSWWLVNVGVQAYMMNKKVLHISLENSEALTARRYVQSMYAMAKSDIGTVRLPRFQRTVEEVRSNVRHIHGEIIGVELQDTHQPEVINDRTKKKVAARLAARKGKGALHIKEFPTGELTVGAYKQYLDYLERRHQFIPDIVIMDYPDLMAVPTSDYRLALGQTFKQIRGIAVRRNHAFVGVTQGNRGSATAKVVGIGMVGEDFSKVQTADTIITYNQTAREKESGLARILVAAARDAEDLYFVSITQAYAIGQFALDSAYLSNDLRTITDAAMGVENEDDSKDD